MGDRVGVVVPAYRADPDRLVAYVESLHATLAPARIHIEIDCPDDSILDRLAHTPATVSTSERRRGKGAAITAGFDRLDTDILAFVDADGSTPASEVGRILEPILDGSVDVTVGSRRHPDAIIEVHQSRVRRRLGDLFALLANQVLPVSLYDYQCGAKALRRQVWRRIRGDIVSPGFAWDIELVCLAAATGAEIGEIPIRWKDCPGSTVRPIRASLEFLRGLARGRHQAKRRQGSRVHRWIGRVFPRPTPLIEQPVVRSRERIE